MRFLRALLFRCIAKPFAYLVLGYSVVHPEHLVKDGPAIIVANHNSHLDTLLLLVLFPARLLPKLRPVAAADYFMKNPLLRWFAVNIVGILPIDRKARAHDSLAGPREALKRGEILILFPEGSRGEPEHMAVLRSGVAHLAEEFPNVPVQPVFLQGAGRSLPKGSRLFVPYRCHAAVGAAMYWIGTRKSYMANLEGHFAALALRLPKLDWEDEA